SEPLKTFQADPKPEAELPSIGTSILTALLPVVLLVVTTLLSLSVATLLKAAAIKIYRFIKDQRIISNIVPPRNDITTRLNQSIA
ncbi:MAG: hypothetical protein ACKPKO_14740, partial [Candidatus Fonsibacter sp.]